MTAGRAGPGGVVLEKFNRGSALGTFGIKNVASPPVSRILSRAFHIRPPLYFSCRRCFLFIRDAGLLFLITG
jgi:hypothetical protein